MKSLLILSIILFLTACNERQSGPEVPLNTLLENTVDIPLNETSDTKDTSSKNDSNDEIILPVLPIVSEEHSSDDLIDYTQENLKFTGGIISDGLDIKMIRSSQNETRTRLVFDSYKSGREASQSGNYTFTYNPKKQQIIAVVNGYRKFSALTSPKAPLFPSNGIVQSIKMETYRDDSGFKFSINLNSSASVNIFELSNPARIIVDITPN